MTFRPRVILVVPTLNAASLAAAFLRSLAKQTCQPESLLIVDSQSVDNTREVFAQYGADVMTIDAKEFDHGTTRQMAVDKYSPSAEIIIFMTQDAILADEDSLEKLVEAFKDERIGAAYGRQLPRQGANPIETHARLFNYSAESQVKTFEDKRRLGIKTCFLSNSFAAYRCSALQAVGGFPEKNIVSEETYAAGKMLESGWKIKYCADATVYHSHSYTITEDFQRNFDVGVFHAHQPWIRLNFGQAEGEGKKFVLSEIAYLYNANFLLLPVALVRTMAKYLGFRFGIYEAYLPNKLKTRLSMQKHYWKK